MKSQTSLTIGLSIIVSALFYTQAQAYPKGPNVSLGSNPIQSWARVFSGQGYHTIDTVNQDFIITDLVLSGEGSSCSARLTSNSQSYDNQFLIATGGWNRNANTYFNGNFNSGMVVPSGTTIYAYVTASGGDCNVNISGYYAH